MGLLRRPPLKEAQMANRLKMAIAQSILTLHEVAAEKSTLSLSAVMTACSPTRISNNLL